MSCRAEIMIRIRYYVLAVFALCGNSLVAGADPLIEPPLRPEDRAHWSFRPPQRPAVPRARARTWVRTPIDAFILARLEAAELNPAPPADKLTLLRRVSFDLTGLPPTPEEVAAFFADDKPNAFEQLIDRLLASPHYGERWAQLWLDVVRYAESNGYEADGERPHAWRYRDYVVNSFRDDKPYDAFLIEQFAGDLLAKDRNPRDAVDALTAVGLQRCGPMHFVGGNVNAEELRQEQLTEMIGGAGSAVLGITIGCARCHDHKFDPLSQADYYRLQAFFAGVQFRDHDLATPAEKKEQAAFVKPIADRISALKNQVAQIDAPYRQAIEKQKRASLEPQYVAALAVPADKRTPEQKRLVDHANILIKVTWDEVIDALNPDDRKKRQQLRDATHELEAKLPQAPFTLWSIGEDPKPPATHLLHRGEVKRKGAAVQPGFPRVIVADGTAAPKTRLDLARWITKPDHPLTARVWVNRIWQRLFGRGLVSSPNDFGTRGARPTHPELLDWLATELVRSGWSTKSIVKLIVLSNAYQQISDFRSQISDSKDGLSSSQSEIANLKSAMKVDPDNHLLWHMNRKRLQAETLRDAMLASAGTLNRQLGGPMVRVPLEQEVYDLIFTEGEPDGLWHVTPDVRQHARRSIYLFTKRNVRLPLLEAFDQPDLLNSCGQRPVSTFAPQALILMNGPIARQLSQAFADRLRGECGTDQGRIVERAFNLSFGRLPRDNERAAALAFLAKPDSLPDFCLALLNLNEFVYVK
jgi:hypothetical protein